MSRGTAPGSGFLLLCVLSACSPTTKPVEGTSADLGPLSRDMLGGGGACGGAAGNLLGNPSFEMDVLPGIYSARNNATPPSTISGPWDACCSTMGQGLTTTFTVVSSAACSGRQAIQINSSAAQDDVLNQERTLTDLGARRFVISGWARVTSAGAGAGLALDVYDLNAPVGPAQVLARTKILSAITPGETFVQLTESGVLPATTPSRIQARVRVTGTLSAFVDDISLVLP